MMVHPTRLVAITLAAASLSACGSSPPSRFYVLRSTATATGAPSAQYAVIVGPVSIPASVDRPEMVVQAGTNRVAVDEFNRWASPLADEIARTVAGNLTVLLGTPRVASRPLANFDPNYRVAIEVQRFASAPGKGATLDAVWTVRGAERASARSGRTVADEGVSDDTYDALVAAHDRALATLSADVAAAIRAAAAQRR